MSVPCIVAGCTSKGERRIKGACAMHDQRLRSTGEYGPPGRLRAEHNQVCQADSCTKKAAHFGLCPMHERRRRLYGDPDSLFQRARRECSAADCHAQHWAKDFCRKHYKRWIKNGTPDLQSFELRFWSNVDRRGPDECWPWTGATLKGYGRGNSGERGYYYAHRLSYEFTHGPIRDGLVIRHRCDNPICVNPSHLEPGTQQDNIQDMIERGRGHWQRQRESRLARPA